MSKLALTKKMSVYALSLFLLTACAVNSNNVDKKQRYVGHLTAVSINGVTVQRAGELIEFEKLQRNVEMSSKLLSLKSSEQFFDTGRQILFSLDFVDGSFETNFGKTVEMIFSYQPCRSVSSVGVSGLTCTDPTAVRPVGVRKLVTLKGGEVAHVPISNGIEWQYKVFDQKEPFISEIN